MGPRRRQQLLVLNVPNLRVGPAGNIGDQLSDAPVRVPSSQSGQGGKHLRQVDPAVSGEAAETE